MAAVSPETIALWLSRDASNLTFRPLIDVAIEVLGLRMPSKSVEDRAEIAELLLPRIISSLERISTESLEDGVEPTFKLELDERTSYLKSVESPASRFLQVLLRMEPQDFEAFCAKALNSMGGRAEVTGRSGDGGVDFVARDLSFSADKGPAPAGARVLVVGQAKRYSRDNLISENDLRCFVGGALRRAADPGDIRTYRRAHLAPLVFAFWTTSDYQPSAKSYARAMGLWYLNGIGLAQLAIRLGVSLGPA
jgi:restriction endonuclease Mrr